MTDYPGKEYQELFNYLSKELGKSLLQSEMDEIISIVHKHHHSGSEAWVSELHEQYKKGYKDGFDAGVADTKLDIGKDFSSY